MAAGAFLFPDKAKLNIASATDVLAGTSTNYRAALVSSAWTPVPSTDELWGDVSTNEIANGNGYSTGGGTLTGYSLAQTSGTVKLTFSAFVWTASGGSIPAWRRIVIYYLGTLNSKLNPLICYALGDSTPADIAATTDGNTLTFTPHASGILTIA